MTCDELPRGARLDPVEHAVERQALHALRFEIDLVAAVLRPLATKVAERAEEIDASTRETARARDDREGALREAPLAAFKDDLHSLEVAVSDAASAAEDILLDLKEYLGVGPTSGSGT